jgi:chromosome segregation ATPase
MTTEGSQLVKILEELRARISTILLDELDIVETEMKTWKKYRPADVDRIANYQKKMQELKTEMADKTEKYHALKRILALQEILPHL